MFHHLDVRETFLSINLSCPQTDFQLERTNCLIDIWESSLITNAALKANSQRTLSSAFRVQRLECNANPRPIDN